MQNLQLVALVTLDQRLLLTIWSEYFQRQRLPTLLPGIWDLSLVKWIESTPSKADMLGTSTNCPP